MQEVKVWSLGQDNILKKETAAHVTHLGNPMDKGVWWTTVHEVVKSQTQLSDQTTATSPDTK